MTDESNVTSIPAPATPPRNNVAKEFIKGVVSEIENAEDRRSVINQEIKDAKAEARRRGIGAAALNLILKRRKLTPMARDELDDEVTILEEGLYGPDDDAPQAGRA